jgi:hypothetical protein
MSVSVESLPDLGDENLVTFCPFVVVVVVAGSGSESLSYSSRGSRTGPLAVYLICWPAMILDERMRSDVVLVLYSMRRRLPG